MDQPRPPASGTDLVRQTLLVLLFNVAGLAALFAVVYLMTVC